jgi:hypothetical protein
MFLLNVSERSTRTLRKGTRSNSKRAIAKILVAAYTHNKPLPRDLYDDWLSKIHNRTNPWKEAWIQRLSPSSLVLKRSSNLLLLLCRKGAQGPERSFRVLNELKFLNQCCKTPLQALPITIQVTEDAWADAMTPRKQNLRPWFKSLVQHLEDNR